MERSSDKVNIGKDFIVQTTAESKLNYGTLSIAGNFEQKNTEDRKNNFVEYSNFIMKFTGETKHTITFEDAMSNSIANLESEGNLDVKGGLHLCGNYDLDGHKMSVEGDLIQARGTLYIDGGGLDVTGDYYLVSKRWMGDDGVTEWNNSSSGILEMVKEKDVVRVGGNFLTYSTEKHRDQLTAGT